jgi:hypothetical protein
MILSHKRRFIFIHVAKTAGTTIKVYLAPHLGPFDLQLGAIAATRQAGIGLNLRTYLDLLRSPSPRSKRALLALRLDKAINAAQSGLYKHRLGRIYDHCGAEEIARFAPREWATYYKFCFVRNPFSRMVSYYKWKTRSHAEPPSFGEMLAILEDGAPHPLFGRDWRSWELYTSDDRIVVDHVARQEDLLAGMRTVCEAIGVPFESERIVRAKETARTDHRDYYGPQERRRVERLFHQEIETFAYRF